MTGEFVLRRTEACMVWSSNMPSLHHLSLPALDIACALPRCHFECHFGDTKVLQADKG